MCKKISVPLDDSKRAEAILHDHPDISKIEKRCLQVVFSTQSKPWSWRMQMVEAIAAHMNPGRFGVASFYIFGSTKNAYAGLLSDIDLLIQLRGPHKPKVLGLPVSQSPALSR